MKIYDNLCYTWLIYTSPGLLEAQEFWINFLFILGC